MRSEDTCSDPNHKQLTSDLNQKTRPMLLRRQCRAAARRLVNRSPRRISGETFVAMMQATDSWNGDYYSGAAMLNQPIVGAIVWSSERCVRVRL